MSHASLLRRAAAAPCRRREPMPPPPRHLPAAAAPYASAAEPRRHDAAPSRYIDIFDAAAIADFSLIYFRDIAILLLLMIFTLRLRHADERRALRCRCRQLRRHASATRRCSASLHTERCMQPPCAADTPAFAIAQLAISAAASCRCSRQLQPPPPPPRQRWPLPPSPRCRRLLSASDADMPCIERRRQMARLDTAADSATLSRAIANSAAPAFSRRAAIDSCFLASFDASSDLPRYCRFAAGYISPHIFAFAAAAA